MLRFEHKLSVARVQDQKMQDLTKYLDRDKTLKENFKSDDRADVQRAIREQRQSVQEQYTAAQLRRPERRRSARTGYAIKTSG